MALRRAALAALLLFGVAVLVAPVADAAKKRVYRTPGYKGIKRSRARFRRGCQRRSRSVRAASPTSTSTPPTSSGTRTARPTRTSSTTAGCRAGPRPARGSTRSCRRPRRTGPARSRSTASRSGARHASSRSARTSSCSATATRSPWLREPPKLRERPSRNPSMPPLSRAMPKSRASRPLYCANPSALIVNRFSASGMPPIESEPRWSYSTGPGRNRNEKSPSTWTIPMFRAFGPAVTVAPPPTSVLGSSSRLNRICVRKMPGPSRVPGAGERELRASAREPAHVEAHVRADHRSHRMRREAEPRVARPELSLAGVGNAELLEDQRADRDVVHVDDEALEVKSASVRAHQHRLAANVAEHLRQLHRDRNAHARVPALGGARGRTARPGERDVDLPGDREALDGGTRPGGREGGEERAGAPVNAQVEPAAPQLDVAELDRHP
jgi:hypothetical protein